MKITKLQRLLRGKLVLGKQKNYTVETAKTLANVLSVKLDDIVD